MFYDNLKKVCKRQGTSVTAVIKEIGLDGSSGTWWKKGSSPSGDILIKLSKRLDVSVDYLLGLADDPVDYENLDENLNAPLDVIDYFGGDAEKIYNFQKAVEQDARNEFYDNNGNLLHDAGVDYREESVITKYRSLDAHGAKMVDLVLNEEYERCAKLQTQTASELTDTEIIETPKGRYKVAHAAAFGGGTMDILIPADVSSEEINRLIDENESLQRQKENQKVAEELKEIIKRNK